jgi:hypothetical protein
MGDSGFSSVFRKGNLVGRWWFLYSVPERQWSQEETSDEVSIESIESAACMLHIKLWARSEARCRQASGWRVAADKRRWAGQWSCLAFLLSNLPRHCWEGSVGDRQLCVRPGEPELVRYKNESIIERCYAEMSACLWICRASM